MLQNTITSIYCTYCTMYCAYIYCKLLIQATEAVNKTAVYIPYYKKIVWYFTRIEKNLR